MNILCLMSHKFFQRKTLMVSTFWLKKLDLGWGVPCLTVHDEYIVPKIDADYVREIMYSTGYSNPELFKSKRIKRI